jgi:amidohydrolase
MASADSFEITIKGKQVHAASPHLGVDPVVVSASCITALQAIRSRRIDPNESMVLSIGSIHGGNRFNIIPDEVKMMGTIRTFSEPIREEVRTMMKQTLADARPAMALRTRWILAEWPIPSRSTTPH